jgi:predicted ATP-grasp superfamily ATP-dependent carboligase
LDVLRAYYLDLTGQAVTQDEVSDGRKWVVENNDLLAFKRYRKDGKITFWKWLRSFRGVREGAWFAWGDPIPFLLMLKNLLSYLSQGIRRRLARKPASENPKASGSPAPAPRSGAS